MSNFKNLKECLFIYSYYFILITKSKQNNLTHLFYQLQFHTLYFVSKIERIQ